MINQINFLKGLAIIGVIFAHIVPYDVGNKWNVIYTLKQQVPIFIMLSGITVMISCEKRGLFKLKANFIEEYKTYVIRRFKGILIAIIIAFIISGLGYIILDKILEIKNGYGIGIYSLVGRFPLDGPGCYYIAILFQLILISPILVYYFNKNPKITLFVMIFLNLIFEMIIAKSNIFVNHEYIYYISILRYFASLGLGMWVSKDFSIKSKRNLFIVLLSPLSLVYIYYHDNYGYTFPGVSQLSWHFQNIFTVFYSAMIVLLVINYMKKCDSKINKLIQSLGKLSFKIFLFQILYFSMGLSIIDNLLIELNIIDSDLLIYGFAVFIDIVLCYIGAKGIDRLENIIIEKYRKIKVKNYI